jgi:hypothetical protein
MFKARQRKLLAVHTNREILINLTQKNRAKNKLHVRTTTSDSSPVVI